MIPIFQGHVLQGKLHIKFRKEFDAYVATLDKTRVEIIVRKRKSKRSDAQNRWYWACVVKLPADAFGYDPEEMHEIYKAMFLKERREIKGKLYEIVRSTTSLNTQEFGEYVEKCRRFAEEQGIVVPDPDSVFLD